MTMIPLKQFTGEFPRLNAQDLPQTGAQYALNVDFTQGNLIGIKGYSPVPGVNTPGAKSVFVYDGLTFSYYSWARDVDAVRSPIASDAYSRFYWADGTNFYVSRGDLGGQGAEPSSTNKFFVGVPQPTAALTQVTANAAQFSIMNMRPYLYGVFCEGTDGSRKGVTLVNGTYTTDTVNSAVISANVSLVCSTFNQAAVTTVSTPTGSVNMNGLLDFVNGQSTASTTTPAVTYSICVEVRLPTDNGGYMSVILREDPNKNTYPTEAQGMAGSFTYSGNTLTVNLRTRADYREARAYTYTYVNQYGEEGPPAPPLVVDMVEGQKITLQYTPPPTTGYITMSKIRVYRTSTGGTGNEYLFVGEALVTSTRQFVDDVKGSALGEAIMTRDFYPPPQNLRGITALPGGALAGFKDNEVWFSEPYMPYAWKPSLVQTVQNKIIGMCAYEGGLYVTTTAHPVLISGVNPGYMTAQKIPAVQAGTSKGSICNVGPFVAYASHDGIVTLRGIDASLDMSFKFFTRDVWRQRYATKLNQMRLNAHDGHLVVWFTDGTPGFLMKLDENQPTMTELSDPVYSATVFPQADALYLGSGNSLYEFKGLPNRLGWSFWSKDFILPKQENLGCLQLVGGGSLTLTVYADGTQVMQTLVSMDQTGSTVVRLPSGFRARRYSFKLDGQADSFVYELNVASAPGELANA